MRAYAPRTTAATLALAVALVVLLCASTGCAASPSAQAGTSRPNVGVVVIGDFGTGRTRERLLGQSIKRFSRTHRVDLLLTVGDNNYASTERSFASNWREDFGWTSKAHIRVAGTLGNHDVEVGGGRYQFKTLGMPGPYYVRRLGGTDFIVLDTNNVTKRQTTWLHKTLARSDARWKIPVFHHPVYTCGSYRNHTERAKPWVPLFESYGVKLVLSGHDHNYQRFRQSEVTYVVDGGGGAALYPVATCPEAYPVAYAIQYSFLYLSIGRQVLSGTAFALDGARLDHFTIRP